MPQDEMREKLKAMSDDELDRYSKAVIEYARTLDPGTPKMEKTGELLRMVREESERRAARLQDWAPKQVEARTAPYQEPDQAPKKRHGCLTAAIVVIVGVLVIGVVGTMFGKKEKPVSTNPNQSLSGETQAENKENEENVAANQNEPNTDSAAAVLESTVIYDSDGIKITATGVSVSAIWNAEVKFLVENNSDKNITFSGDNVIINGVTIPCWLYIDAAAGKKANGSMLIAAENIRTAGIQDIATVSCKDSRVLDSDSFETLYTVPFSLETSISGTYTQGINSDGDIIFEQSGVTLIAQVVSSEFYGNSVQILAKNESGKDVIVQADNISVNGFTISGWMYDTVYDGTVRFCGLDVFSSGLEENGIEEIKDVTFTIKIIDAGSYDEIAASDEIQIFAN